MLAWKSGYEDNLSQRWERIKGGGGGVDQIQGESFRSCSRSVLGHKGLEEEKYEKGVNGGMKKLGEQLRGRGNIP